MDSYQQGSIQSIRLRRDGTAYRLFCRVRLSDGSWEKKSKTLPHGTTRKTAQSELRKILVEAKDAGIQPAKPHVTFSTLVKVHLTEYLTKQNVRRSTNNGYHSI